MSQTSRNPDTAPSFDLAGPSPDYFVPAPLGNKVLSGFYLLNGVTSDDWIIAQDVARQTLIAVPEAGGSSVNIDVGFSDAAIHGMAVFSWDAADPITRVGPLNTWTAAAGPKSRVALTSIVGITQASADGRYLFYADGADAQGTSANLILATADGVTHFQVASGAVISSVCAPRAAFTTAGMYLFYCPSGTTHSAVYLVNLSTGHEDLLMAGLNGEPFSVNPAGEALVVDQSDQAWVVTTANTQPVALMDPMIDGFITADGQSAIYVAMAGALRRVQLSAQAAPVTLVPSGCHALLYYYQGQDRLPALSPDGKWVVYSSRMDASSDVGDLWLAATGMASAPLALTLDPSGYLSGSPFTGDSQSALFFGTSMDNGVQRYGQFATAPVSGGAAMTWGDPSWVAWGGAKSKVAYGSNWQQGGLDAGEADLWVGDTAAPNAAPVLVATQAEARFFLDGGQRSVIYSMTGMGLGVFVYSIP